jgi:hypothetical protein
VTPVSNKSRVSICYNMAIFLMFRCLPSSEVADMNVKIEDLSLAELKALIDETIDKRIEDRLGDPDAG